MDLLLKEKAAALRSGGGRAGEGHAPEGAAGHAQDRVDAFVHKAMVHQVHVVGEGVIGQAALTGAHRWILHDSLDECGEADEVLLEMKDQFCAGIHLFLIHGLDHLLRLASIQTVIHPNIGSLDFRVTLFFLAALEVIRRGHWSFYRLENEHLNNAGKFRSVKVIPWYYAMRNWEITTTYPGTDTLQAAKMFWNSIPRDMAQLFEVYHVLNDII